MAAVKTAGGCDPAPRAPATVRPVRARDLWPWLLCSIALGCGGLAPSDSVAGSSAGAGGMAAQAGVTSPPTTSGAITGMGMEPGAGSAGASGASAQAGASAAGSGASAAGSDSVGMSPAGGGGGGSAAPGTAGSAGTAVVPDAGSSAMPQTTNACGTTLQLNRAPFGCAFAWGANGNEGGRDAYLDFITTWVGYEWTQNREQECDGCRLAAELAGKKAVAVYYAYFIGSALPDCNVDPNGKNLCTDGARYIRDNRARILEVYGQYARKTHEASPNKSVVWLLEGDFVQYTETTQSAPLTMTELGALARDITCAIRAAQPKAVVAINHTTWNSDEETDAFWRAMPLDTIDFVWTTGVGDNMGFFNHETNASSYNGKSATYRHVHMLTGKPIWVDTSFGLSQQADSWTGVAASELARRSDEGVFAVNVTMPPADYAARLTAIRPALDPICP